MIIDVASYQLQVYLAGCVLQASLNSSSEGGLEEAWEKPSSSELWDTLKGMSCN